MSPDTPSSLIPDWTDAELVQSVLAGDPSAGSEFVDRFEKLIYSILIRQCGIPEGHQEDAFNHVFVKLFEDDCRRLRSWRGESAMSTFLFVVVRNLGRDYREKEFGREKYMLEGGDDGGEDIRDGDMPTPEDEIVVSSMEKVIRDLVSSLEEICSRIIDMRFMQDLSYKEIALAAGLTVTNVGVRLHRCLDALAQLMKREFPDLFEDRFNFDL
jgi:RNA polymerase sigma-70 factor (ECF subfamily)